MDLFKMIWTGILLRFKVFFLYYALYSAAAYHIISYETLPEYYQGKDKFIIFVLAVISSYVFMTRAITQTKPKPTNDKLTILKPGQKIN